MIDTTVKKFIEENIGLIDNNMWEEVYTKATSVLSRFNKGAFTQLLYSVGINPLEDLTYIPEAYLSGAKIDKFVIPDNVTTICDWAFYFCNSLESVTIPDSVTIIGNYAFCDCDSLVSITIPDSVTSIGSSAISNCTSLKSVTISNNVTKIDNAAFFRCPSLTSVTIPNNVRNISNYAFSRCTSLIRIDYNGTKEQWNAISKGEDWNANTGNYTVYCTDGKLVK